MGFYEKKSSNMPRVIWAEKSYNGLRFEIGPSYDGLATRSQCPSDGQSGCTYDNFLADFWGNLGGLFSGLKPSDEFLGEVLKY